MRPTPKALVLEILSAAAGVAVPVRELLRSCAVFEIPETTVRVALVRLAEAGLIESAARGEYQLGAKAQTLAREVGSWSTVERRVLRTWDGAYLGVQLGPPSTRSRPSERALQLAGFRELEPGFAVRPDNLQGSAAAMRARLGPLGVEAAVFRATDFDPATEGRIRKLWDGKALTTSYFRSRDRLNRWLQKADSLDPVVAARECFLIGGEAIRQIVYDPLLPAPFVDPKARRAFIESMRVFDRAGRAIWLRLFGVGLGAPEALQQWVH